MWTKIILTAILVILSPFLADAACTPAVRQTTPQTWTTASAGTSDVQACVDLSANGDTVQIPNGSATWTSGISTTKQITIRAQNYTPVKNGRSTQSVIITNNYNSGPLFSLTTGDSNHVGLYGIRFNEGTSIISHLHLYGSGTKVALINDCYFEVNGQNRFGTGNVNAAIVSESLGGVMWNCYINGVGTIADIALAGTIWIGSPRGWDTASTMGMLDTNGDQNFYIEDSTVKNGGNNTAPDVDVRGRFVMRYSTMDGSAGGTHGWTSRPNEGRQVEYYNNTYTVTTANRNLAAKYYWIRAGTAVFTDNVVNCGNVGYGNNVQAAFVWEGACSDNHATGYGWNGGRVLDPIYIWNNTGTCAYSYGIDTPACIRLNIELYVNNGAKPGYTKYTYPHPLRTSGVNFPLRISASGKYLEDQSSVPFQVVADAGWDLTTQISDADAITYLDNRLAKGFNAVELRVIGHENQTNAPNDYYNNAPFTLGHSNWSVRNETYWARIDTILSAAKTRGMAVLMFPAYLGYACGSQGWCADMQSQTDAVMTNYGTWIGNRYKDYGNIIWMIGGDADASLYPNALARVTALRTGIIAGDPDAFFSVEPAMNTLGGADSYVGLVNINGIYAYGNTDTMAQRAYGLTNPFMHQEGYYENEHSSSIVYQESQAFSTYLGGGLIGHVFGSCPLWSFGTQTGYCDSLSSPYNSWSNCMNSTGSTAQGNIGKLMRSRKWWTLVPDYANTVVTSAKGSDTSYHATARETSGKTVMVWCPVTGNVTVDMSKITDSGSQAKAWWWNPADNVGTLIGTYANSGSRVFTPPAALRVLVIDSNVLALAAPGSTVYAYDGGTTPTPPSAQGCTLNGASFK